MSLGPYAGARAQIAALAKKKVSARELLDAAVARNEAIHAKINAVVVQDLEAARKAAQAFDDARARGESLGRLAGLPMTIKDGLDVIGMPARAGNPEFAHRPKDCADAEVVARTRRAGAVIWGKTNVPFMLSDLQSTNAIDGTTNNPYDVTRTPGGSSGGAAAALAAGVTALEIGSDIGGSLRHPANFCGVFALKPTHGLLPLAGHVPPPPGLDAEVDLGVVGPMARSADDLRLLFETLSETPQPASPVAGLRVAVWTDEPGWPVDPVVKEAVERAAEALAKAGVTIMRLKPAVDARGLTFAYQKLLFAILGAGMPPEVLANMRAQREVLEPAAAASSDLWSPPRRALAFIATDAERAAAETARSAAKRRLKAFFDGADAILTPTTPVPAFMHDHTPQNARTIGIGGRMVDYMNLLNWIVLATACHAPAVAVPATRTPEGLPVGVQLVGRWNEDRRLLDLAQALETGLGGFVPPPL